MPHASDLYLLWLVKPNLPGIGHGDFKRLSWGEEKGLAYMERIWCIAYIKSIQREVKRTRP